ncbi:hypothetical protein D3C87_1675890 [compost metagenome]
MSTSPANRKNPPSPVTLRAVSALFLETAWSLLKPIKKNELILVSSQKVNNRKILSESTSPSMADINRHR